MQTAVTEVSAAPIPGAFTKVDIRSIPLALIDESPWNPRQYFPEKEMAELTESMRQSGFHEWAPLVTRPKEGGRFETGAGHRRRQAALAAGLETAPCIVRDMDDVEFLDVLNFDNSLREEVHPLHEAAGWQAWMEKTGKGVADIAARLGQSLGYVYQRLKYAALIESGRKAFLDGVITAGHAILIARLQPADQKKALKFCGARSYDGYVASVRELAAFIQRDIHLDLAHAAFDLASADLVPAAGTCIACPKRTGYSPDLKLAGVDRETDECTDPACFNAKLGEHLVRIKAALNATGQAPLEVSSTYGNSKKKGVLDMYAYRVVEESEPGSTPAIITDGKDAGKVVQIKLNRNHSTDPEEERQARESREREDKKRDARVQVETLVRVKLLEAVNRRISSTSLLRSDLESLLSAALNGEDCEGVPQLCRLHGVPLEEDDEEYEAAEKLSLAIPKLPDVEIFRLVIELSVVKELGRFVIGRNEPPKGLMALAKRFKVDAVQVRRDTEESLKSAEGGTRREVEKPATKKAAPAAAAKKAAPKKKATAPAKKAAAPKKSATNKPVPGAKKKAAKK